MKKVVALVLTLSVFLSLAACSVSFGEKYALTVDGVRVSDEIYSYYLDAVISDPEKYGLEPEPDKASVREKVKYLCTEYVAVCSEYANMGLELGVSSKYTVSDRVGKLWLTFGSYYGSKGISKQTITKIETYNATRDALFTAYYGENGTRAVNSDEVKRYFETNYVGFRAIIGYFFKSDENGTEILMTTEEKTETVKKFNEMKDQIDAGTNIEDLGNAGAGTYGINYADFTVLKSDSADYPIGFFQAVWALENGKASTFALDNYVFLVVREDLSKKEDGYFEQYRGDCLKALRSDEFERIVDYMVGQYSAKENDLVINGLFKKYR
ncbi:MAG: hypothetical protein K5756_08090 [Clostridiales bacterium]|nr:hypothetical protein [Clostridiales bacterium]